MNFPYQLRYFADMNPGSGYQVATRGYLKALQTLGIGPEHVHLIPAITSSMHASDVDLDDWVVTDYLQHRERPDRKDVNIVHLHPPFCMRHWALNFYNVAITAWETSALPKQTLVDADNKPRTTVDGLNQFDEIWVPRELVKETFIASGVTKPIYVIPHALLPELLELPPKGKLPQIGKVHPKLVGTEATEEPLRFYYIGSFDQRKNVEALLQAYFATGWNVATPVELVLHCVPPSRDRDAVEAHGWLAQEAVRGLIATAPDATELPCFSLNVTPRSYDWVLKLHQQGHVFITASRGEGFCLAPETVIDTEQGPRRLDEVRADDFVFSHRGQLCRVVGTTQRHVEEDVFECRWRGCSESLVATANHPHLVLPRNGRRHAQIKKALDQGETPVWRPVHTLRKGDFVIVPKPQLPVSETSVILQTPGNRTDGVCTWFAGSYKKLPDAPGLNDIARIAGTTFQYASRVLNKSTRLHGQQTKAAAIIVAARVAQYVRPEPIRAPRNIIVDSAFAEFLGLYIAEGSTISENHAVQLSAHAKETWAHARTKDVGERVFGAPTSLRIQGNKATTTISSSAAATLLTDLCGRGARAKHIPHAVYDSPFVWDVIRGLFYGDGSAAGGSYRFYTTSRQLAVQVRQKLLSANVFTTFERDSRKNGGFVLRITGQFNERFSMLVCPWKYDAPVALANRITKNNYVIETRDAFYVPVKSVTRHSYCGIVMNLHVAEDESYTVNGVATHNCLPAAEAAAMGNMIVGSEAAIGHLADGEANILILSSRQTNVRPMPHVAGYELQQKWWDVEVDTLTAAFKEALRLHQSKDLRPAGDTRHHYNPTAVGLMLQARLEHIKSVLDATGW